MKLSKKVIYDIIKNEALSGNKEASSWLNGEGYIDVYKDGKEYFSRYVRYDSMRAGTLANQWRVKVFERDNYTCRECGKRGQLQAHHKKSWAENVALRFNVRNGITLCVDCHAKKHTSISNLIKNSKYSKGLRV
jgi:nitrate/TMAO reductase-like tetraheme cytochrome c subunit